MSGWKQNVLLGVVVLVIGGWQLRDAFPPPDCTVDNAAEYDGEEMYDFAIKRQVLWNRDAPESACWFEKSALAGYASSATSIGIRYEQGRGVERDLDKAMAWFERAIEMDNSGGAYRLGKLYDEGKLVPKDEAKALVYFKQAARMGNSGTIKRLRDAGD